ncbi:MAG TPA: sigma factor-like helix-turn-helix DNA-binding protein [archaeon]|nr:sigma factor-like helix-turn-helix DNA-binding protein [archaeon]
MEKTMNMALRLLGHKLGFGFQIRLDYRESLERRNDSIVHDFRQGYTIGRLADKYNLTENRISQVLIEFGARRPKWRKMTPEARRRILLLEKEGLSKAEIGRKIGVSRERVRQILQQ